MTTLNLDLSSLTDQISRRAAIEVERRRLALEEEAAREALKEAQQDRPDYLDLLRAQVRSCLQVENTGDYPADLAECIATLNDLIGEIPDDLLVADHEGITSFGRGCVRHLGLMTVQDGHWLLKPEDPKIDNYVRQSLKSMLPVRIFLNLLSERELRERIFLSCVGTSLSARLASLINIIYTVFRDTKVEEMTSKIDEILVRWGGLA